MTDRPNLLIFAGIDANTRAGLSEHFTIHEIPAEGIDAFLDRVGASIVAVATGGSKGLPASIRDRLPALEIIACFGVGYEALDAEPLAEKGVMVTHTPDVLDDEVANTTIALLLAVTRRIVAYDRYLREGRWQREGDPPFTHGLSESTVGILGLGRIGLAIASKLAVFGCRIVYHTRKRREDVDHAHYEDLVEMARDCDILISIVPGGEATNRIVNRSVIEALGPNGTLISIGRGSSVDEPELVRALQEGRLGAAGLDVFENEPNVPEPLLAMDNVVLLPHVGSATEETRAAMAQLVVDNLVSWFENGKALTPVPECAKLSRKQTASPTP